MAEKFLGKEGQGLMITYPDEHENFFSALEMPSFKDVGIRSICYEGKLHHHILKETTIVKAADLDVFGSKINAVFQRWLKKYEKQNEQIALEEKLNTADDLTAKLEEQREALEGILRHALENDNAVNFSKHQKRSKESEKFRIPKPKKPIPKKLNPLPDLKFDEYTPPEISFFDKLFRTVNAKVIKAQEAYKEYKHLETSKHRRAVELIAQENERIDQENRIRDSQYKQQIRDWQQAMSSWEEDRQRYRDEISDYNNRIEKLEKSWLEGDRDAIIEHAELVLSNSDYKSFFEPNFDIFYDEKIRLLILVYQLPPKSSFPFVKHYRLVKYTGELKATQMPHKDQKELFDSTCFQIALRSIYELFEADMLGHIDQIAFNGRVKDVDLSTGQSTNSIILSLLVSRDEIMEMNLSAVDPKECFKKLKGVAASSLSSMTPIEPLIDFDKSDRRFIEGKNVPIDNTTNLAAMNWEEFEHLVRNIFELEFASRGGEVKVTQTTADGGVDAIAFDPDSITGGKIVIQAKRYTNTVGVSAVRDLYGTVMNEGASKGILVTTSNYGPDAYKFAAGKPLTLMSGSHLLHLLQKHGIKATINLKEARKKMGLQ